MKRIALKNLKVLLLYFFILSLSFLQTFADKADFAAHQGIDEGSFLVYFIDEEENELSSITIDFPSLEFSVEPQESTSYLTTSDRKIRVHNSKSYNRVELSLAPNLETTGIFKNDAKWLSGEDSYPIYSEDINEGSFHVNPYVSIIDTYGCNSEHINLGTPSSFLFVDSFYENNIESIDLFTTDQGNFCRFDLQGTEISQIVPSHQPAGDYSLDMVLTATGHSEFLGFSEEEIDDLIILDDYIPVANADELNLLRFEALNTFGLGTRWEREYVGGLDKKYIQVADIDLDQSPWNTGDGWEPLGTLSSYIDFCEYSDPADEGWYSFTGIYQGAGYTISNLYMDRGGYDYPVGLFGGSEGGAFYNINLVDVDITGNSATAALLGLAYGNFVEIDNVNISSATTHSYNKVGGLIGSVRHLHTLNIKNSSYDGNVLSSSQSAGGLMGEAFNFSEILVENTHYDGDVLSSGNYHTGGVVGRIGYEIRGREQSPLVYNQEGTLKIKNFIFEGDIIGGQKTGGITGLARFMDAIYVDRMTFEGNIAGGTKTGGFIGFSEYVAVVEILNSEYRGTVDNWYTKAGGFIGSLRMFDSLRLENLIFEGEVLGGYNKVGGLVGEITTFSKSKAGDDPPRASEVIVQNAHVKGFVYSDYNKVGGLMGSIYFVDDIEISDSSYEGNLMVDDGNAGGFLGYVMEAYSIKIKNSSVNADIHSFGNFSNIGGFIGILNAQETLLENLTFHGRIRDSWVNTGGLIGHATSNPRGRGSVFADYTFVLDNPTIEIKGCYVEGEITPEDGDGTMSGGLIGRATNHNEPYRDYTKNVLGKNVLYEIKISESGAKVSIDANGNRVGGLVGRAHNITIENSFFDGDLNVTPGGYYLKTGGLVGEADEISISDSYSRANITATLSAPSCRTGLTLDHYFGGIVGRVHEEATIENSYYAGTTSICNLEGVEETCVPVDTTVYPYTFINAVAGSADKTTMNRVYYDRLLTDLTDSLAESKKTSEMKDYNLDTYVGWDFNKVWGMTMILNDGYPILLSPEGLYDIEHTVRYTSTTGGSVSPRHRKVFPGRISEAPSVTANSGYTFVNFTIEMGSEYGALLNPLTGEVSNVLGSMTIRANFTPSEDIDQETGICETPSGRLYGDINNDGHITKDDRILLTRYVLELESLDSESIEAGDLNEDGKVNVQDIILLERYLTGLIKTFPVCIDFTCGSKLLDSRDFKEYSTVEIGEDCWMGENLNYVSNNSWCYNYDADNCDEFGRLYTWGVAKHICPAGWSLPKWNKFSALINAIGGETHGDKLKATTWDGNNESGFSALPAGASKILLINVEQDFEGLGEMTSFWSFDINQYDETLGRMMLLLDYDEEYEHEIFVSSEDKFAGLSVRCIKD